MPFSPSTFQKCKTFKSERTLQLGPTQSLSAPPKLIENVQKFCGKWKSHSDERIVEEDNEEFTPTNSLSLSKNLVKNSGKCQNSGENDQIGCENEKKKNTEICSADVDKLFERAQALLPIKLGGIPQKPNILKSLLMPSTKNFNLNVDQQKEAQNIKIQENDIMQKLKNSIF